MKRIRLSALLLAVLSIPASSWAGCKLGECLLGVTGNGILGVMSMHDMEGDRWVVQVSPGYMSGKVGTAVHPNDTFDMKGYSGAFAVKREFTANWGFGLVGGFTTQSGDSTLDKPSGLAPNAAHPELVAGGFGTSGHSGGTISGMYGNAVAALVTFDPFSSPDGFRLPISAGPLMMWEGFKFRHEFTNTSAANAAQVDTAEVKRSNLGFLANASLDFLVYKKFRIMPGLSVGYAPGSSNYATYDYVVTRNGAAFGTFTHETAMMPMFTSIYTTIQYRPWDVGFNYVILSMADKIQTFSITVTKKFGGKS